MIHNQVKSRNKMNLFYKFFKNLITFLEVEKYELRNYFYCL